MWLYKLFFPCLSYCYHLMKLYFSAYWTTRQITWIYWLNLKKLSQFFCKKTKSQKFISVFKNTILSNLVYKITWNSSTLAVDALLHPDRKWVELIYPKTTLQNSQFFFVIFLFLLCCLTSAGNSEFSSSLFASQNKILLFHSEPS